MFSSQRGHYWCEISQFYVDFRSEETLKKYAEKNSRKLFFQKRLGPQNNAFLGFIFSGTLFRNFPTDLKLAQK
jgi:hypothetical protein